MKIELDSGLVEAILQYLSKKPFEEVWQLIQTISQVANTQKEVPSAE